MVEFKLLGIPVRVEAIFWITLGLLGFIGIGIEGNGLLLIALFVLAGFISILIHEMGHALMIRKYGLPTQVVLAAFGGYAQYPAGYLTRKQDFLVTLAGPASQLLCGLGVFFALPYLQLPNNLVNEFLWFFLFVSIFWSVLNCLPVLPLDGGRMLAAIMGPRRLRQVLMVSIVTAVAVALFAVFMQAMFGAILMGMFAYQNIQDLKRVP
ncbi:Zn-dependent protease (includes SpoIVFB) [Rubritalea squalenifaciens DSM 18772]|uniref:Zn-dependent protease (Includes SpoIVFB) n=1 Tax=Rubritalea squalenifaciens DSM 18772 TaxID=1123071 RepID=A0A1M6RZF5_9BACT|nr:site-2 protease family protein [Rubritalea squalenifaciens]SHK37942.1 Zn-dependent protease (includes SpoIVFB) [Rubritalea squalenifaciens DSM 18772]